MNIYDLALDLGDNEWLQSLVEASKQVSEVVEPTFDEAKLNLKASINKIIDDSSSSELEYILLDLEEFIDDMLEECNNDLTIEVLADEEDE